MSEENRVKSGHRQSGSYSRRSAGALLLVGVVAGATLGGFAVVRATSGSSSASSFVPVAPVRVLDTRSDLGLVAVTDGVAGTLKVTGSIPTATSAGVVNAVVVPAGATAVVLNVTAVNPTAGGYVSLRPGDATGAPTVSTLNVTAGGTFPNGATITVPTTGPHAGEIQVWYEAEYTTVGSTELLIDIAGYYVLASSGPAGPQGETGVAGPAGPQGETGPAGANGTTTNSHIKNICGVDGTSACAVGLKGPGGGIVFMTPSTPGNTSGLFYEAAPSTWHSSSGDPLSGWCNNTTDLLGVASSLTGTGAMDGAAKTAVMLGVCTSGAANLADAYTATVNGVVYGDWFLPSKGELNQMYVNRIAIGGFFTDNYDAGYLSSSESIGNSAWTHRFNDGLQVSVSSKGGNFYVRPVRAFGATLALACADGGVCAVGDTGPGGGKVFYVHASGSFACGATLSSTCKYLEAAPTTGTNNWTDATFAWSDITNVSVGADGQGTAIGTGYKNTQAMVAQSSTANRAGTIARAYRGPHNLSDWYLPSKNELNQLYIEKARIGGFLTDWYWSSSEVQATEAWPQHFGNGLQYGYSKTSPVYVRPVRAF